MKILHYHSAVAPRPAPRPWNRRRFSFDKVRVLGIQQCIIVLVYVKLKDLVIIIVVGSYKLRFLKELEEEKMVEWEC